jgi:hypothetical protein
MQEERHAMYEFTNRDSAYQPGNIDRIQSPIKRAASAGYNSNNSIFCTWCDIVMYAMQYSFVVNPQFLIYFTWQN